MAGRQQLFVRPEWLAQRLHEQDLVVLDATWYLPVWGKDAAAGFRASRIPGSKFFDIDGVADASGGLPHMLPSEQQFAAVADALGITNDSRVVLYDRTGLYSAPRVWWTFKVLGHDRVCLLEGGYPAWLQGQFPVDDTPAQDADVLLTRAAAQRDPSAATTYKATKDLTKVRSLQQVLANISAPPESREQVVDVRSRGRFLATEPEPRPSLRGGHIPGSLNVPFTELYDAGGMEGGKLKAPEELLALLASAGVRTDKPIVASCGSGLTACILALALYSATGQLVNVYDGAWMEWGAREDTPVETGMP